MLGKLLCKLDKHSWKVLNSRYAYGMYHFDVECKRCKEKRKLKRVGN